MYTISKFQGTAILQVLCQMAFKCYFISLLLFLGGFHKRSPKFKLRKKSILLSFYFHEVLQQLKTLIYTNFQFQRVLHFAIEDAWISRLLRDSTFSWLTLGKAFGIFTFFHFPDSGLSVLTSLHFIFDGVTVKTQN